MQRSYDDTLLALCQEVLTWWAGNISLWVLPEELDSVAAGHAKGGADAEEPSHAGAAEEGVDHGSLTNRESIYDAHV